MKAQNVLLTHFSARYPKMPPSLSRPMSPDRIRGPIVSLAFDHALTRIGDMGKLRAYLPAIQMSFEDTTEQGDHDSDPSKVSW